MYGDCQVVLASSMGENGVSSDHSLFNSPIRNPNFNNFMASMPFHPFTHLLPLKEEEHGMVRTTGKEEMMMESMSGGSEQLEGAGGISGNEQEGHDHMLHQHPPTTKKKRYHRHTAHQIQEMEALFRECPHPDDKQRMKLSQELGLKPRQVKFWFQNRRTQMKAQQDRADNVILRAENDSLKNENYRLQAVLRCLICPSCGGTAIMGELAYDEQQLRLENTRLKEELDRVCSVASRYTGRSVQSMGPPHLLPPPSLDLDMSIYSRHLHEPLPSSCPEMMGMALQTDTSQFTHNPLIMDEERALAMELAVSSMDELVKMCHLNEPLWVRRNQLGVDLLNVDEHARMFPWPVGVKQHYNELRTEGTRDSAVVIMNSINLVDAFLDASKWMELFPSIVSRAKTVQVVSSGVAGHASGSLHLMYGELQVMSPLVPTREAYFLRYSHHNGEEGTWAIVDFPIDNFNSNSPHLSFPRYRRRPSGCIIQDMPNGYSRVTWVEHGETIEEKPVHQIFNQYVQTGLAFGAKRWLAVLQRQCERVASLMARNIPDLGVIQSPEARKNLMKLAQRMIRTFCLNVSGSGGQSWTALSDSPQDTVRITTRKITEPGQPNGVILSAVSTTWLPYSHDVVFNFLRNERRRSQLEALSSGSSLHEVAHIANGFDPGNSISLLRINVASNSSQNVELMLQESCTDASGSLVVYSTVEVDYIQLVMSGEDPSCIPLLPLGFSILPLNPSHIMTDTIPPSSTNNKHEPNANNNNNNNNNNTPVGCLLTLGLQVHASTIPSTKLNLSSVTAINNHIRNAIQQINAALSSNGPNPENPCGTSTG